MARTWLRVLLPEFVTMRRPLRSKPYYFDIPNSATGTTLRHWFNLNH